MEKHSTYLDFSYNYSKVLMYLPFSLDWKLRHTTSGGADG